MLSHLKVHHPLKYTEARAASAKSKCNKQGQKNEILSDSAQFKQVTLQETLKPKYSRQSKKW